MSTEIFIRGLVSHHRLRWWMGKGFLSGDAHTVNFFALAYMVDSLSPNFYTRHGKPGILRLGSWGNWRIFPNFMCCWYIYPICIAEQEI